MDTLQTLLAGLRAHGDRIALHAFTAAGEERLSYAVLCDQAERVAAGLAGGLGLKAGDRAAIAAANRPSWVVVRFAMIAAGVTAVPLDDMSGPEDIARALDNSGATVLFTTREMLSRLAPLQARAGLRLIVLDDEDADAVPSWRSLVAETTRPQPVSRPEDIAALIYTSGTTGVAKGVPLTHANILANVRSMASGGFAGTGDRVLLPLPLHHAFPFIVGLVLPFVLGATVLMPASVAGPDIARALKDGRATVMVGVPRLYEAFAAAIRARLATSGGGGRLFARLLALSIALRRRFGWRVGHALLAPVRNRVAPDLRLMGCGGAKLDEAVAWTLEGLGFEVLTGYGLVETASVSTYNRRGHGRIGTEGLPGDGVELRIAEPDETGVGEIQIRGPHVFAGYHDDARTTAEVFTADGWFRSGDLGRLDAGSVVVVGRRKEVIVLPGGKNIGPEEVETALTASPYVQEAGVLEKDGALVALIVPNMAALQASETARIDQLLRVAVTESVAGLAPYKRVSGFRILRDPLPKTRLGKIRRFALPALYAAAETAGRTDRAPTEDEARRLASAEGRRVMAILARRHPAEPITLDTSPQLDLGIDSLAWIELAAEIESETTVALDETVLSRIVTVGDLLREVSERAATTAPAPEALPPFAPLPATGAARAAGFLLHAGVRLAMRLLFRLRAEGAPPVHSGPLLLVANHASDLDPFAISAAMPWHSARRCWWGAEVTRMFTTRPRRFLARAAQVFPVDDRRPTASLAHAEAVLKSGQTLVWFPESWRSPDGSLQEFLRGVGVLAIACRPTVVPVWIEGAFEAMPRQRHWPRLMPIRVRFGAPVSADAYVASTTEGDAARATADALRSRLDAFSHAA